MSDELLSYYNSELTYLRELGAEFAEKYPKVAGRLHLEADKCEDPHVERLLEGFAFLAARIRHKLDDEFPEITDALLGVLYPYFQRPLPSMSVVQFVLGREQVDLNQGFTVPRGSRLNTRPVGGTPCSFVTTYPATLWPVSVESARFDPDRVIHPDRPPDAVALIQLGLRCSGAATFSTLALDRLRIYLDGTGAVPSALYEALLNDTCRVVVRGGIGDDRFATVELPADAIQPVGFGLDEGMFPYPNRSFPGYRLLQEYFTFPEKFLFVDVTGLSRVAPRGFGDSVELLFFLRRPPREVPAVQPENFRLGCAPIVNLFPQVAEPITLDQTRAEYRVVPDVHRPMATEVYSIDEVASTTGLLDDPIRYEPFFAMRHATEGKGARTYWSCARRPSPRKEDPGTEVYITFVDSAFSHRAPAGEMVTVRTTCTNRDLPSRLPFGGEQGDFEIEGKSPVSRVRCLRRPTRPARPPLGRAAQWALISHLALNHLSLADSDEGLDGLRALLHVYDFIDSAVTRQQIAGVTGVSSRRVAGRTGRKAGNAVCLGVEVTLQFDESKYVGSGAFLLASVLERFLGLYVSINSFSQLVSRTRQREGILKRWTPRAGERSLL
jgi:type VI secretion system protein ImpG